MQYDALIEKIAEYIYTYTAYSELALETAYHALLDTLGCGLLALKHPECVKLLGPWVSGTTVRMGVQVPGTAYVLDPVKAAFDIGVMNRWLDFNDTWLAKEWGHPSDNLGALLSVCVYKSHVHKEHIPISTLLEAMIKAYEIQGMLAIDNSFNEVGLDHVLLVKVASAGLCVYLLGGTQAHCKAALSQAWLDGQALRVYRHAPNTGSRKSWAAGDATSRGLQLALLTLMGEAGYPSSLSVQPWGFESVCFKDKPVIVPKALGCYVMENILFKIAFPAEFHGQTAVECALQLHRFMRERSLMIEDIAQIQIYTQSAAMRIIQKTGPLLNYADRDHCLEYMVSCALLTGTVNDHSYSNLTASDPRIELLRSKMVVQEDPVYSKDYLDPKKRSIANRIILAFNQDKSAPLAQEVQYPLGHRQRRKEGIPFLLEKFTTHVVRHYPEQQAEGILELCLNRPSFVTKSISDIVKHLAVPYRVV